MFVQNATEVCRSKRLFQARRLWGRSSERCEWEKGRGSLVGSKEYFSRPTLAKKVNYWPTTLGQPRLLITTSVCLTYFRSVFLLIKKNCHLSDQKDFSILSEQSVSRNANSASICKFKSKPSILNRVVPQVLLHNLTKQLLIFN